MKKNINLLLLILHLFLIEISAQSSNGDINRILKDYRTYWYYLYNEINLTKTFTPVNQNGKKISKKSFLDSLITGKYIPLKAESKTLSYKLIRPPKTVSIDIFRSTIVYAHQQKYYERTIGNRIKGYSFRDIYNRKYDESNCLGKVLLINTWFTKCQPCIQEIPELNKFAVKYKHRDDIVLFGFANDGREKLLRFQDKFPFYFTIIPDMEGFTRTNFKIPYYPAFILVNRYGKIIKSAGKLTDIIDEFEIEINR